ncbi:MAG TPA: putative baseplate assembly protein [Thermoanaerobaculia bacterium]
MSASEERARELSPCGCCEGLTVQTPAEISNRPGLSAIDYRVGVHGQFKHSLLVRLSNTTPALRDLATRDDDDFSIALLDAWALVADVLTFYQERIANESYLRTAMERLSILYLARLIGYELRPGVAASAYMAFTMEEVPGVDKKTTAALGVPNETKIPTGVKMQSVPRPGEVAQTFETIESIQARREWNAVKPRLTRRHPLPNPDDPDILYFAGLAPGLKKGDALIITPDVGDPEFRQIAEVTSEDKKDRTKVRLEPPVTSTATTASPSSGTSASASTATMSSTTKIGSTAQKYLNQTVNTNDLYAIAYIEQFYVADLFDNLTAAQPSPPSVAALRARAAIFGHNAPRWTALPVSLRIGEYAPQENSTTPVFEAGPYKERKDNWVDSTTLANYPDPESERPEGAIFLDTVYPGITAGSLIGLKGPGKAAPFKVKEVTEVSKSDFTLSAKVTRLTLEKFTRELSEFKARQTSVFVQSEELPLARLPILDPVKDDKIDLNTWVQGLFAGQKIIVCGELDQESGVTKCEMAIIKSVEHNLDVDGFTTIKLTRSLSSAYVLDTVMIFANVALATHGETVTETLGNGDSTQPFQQFALRQPPLTYVTSASTPTGSLSTLEIRVNDILWKEVPDFYGHGPEEHIYITRLTDDGVTTVQFGDGKTGARLPTGQENVRAKYRKGIGTPGLVQANQISQLLDRPLGVKAATNPIESGGAGDPESRDDARKNAPLTVLTLGRIVSLRDYEDFARAFSGIGKATATWSWTGEHRTVVVTVAGPAGATVSKDSPLYSSLLGAMRTAGDLLVPLDIEPYRPGLFRISANVLVDPTYLTDKVLAAVEQRLRKRFSFEARNFGQPVILSEVIAAMQSVKGVVSVSVDALYAVTEPLDPKLNTRLDPESGPNGAAGLLVLDPNPIDLKAVT